MILRRHYGAIKSVAQVGYLGTVIMTFNLYSGLRGGFMRLGIPYREVCLQMGLWAVGTHLQDSDGSHNNSQAIPLHLAPWCTNQVFSGGIFWVDHDDYTMKCKTSFCQSVMQVKGASRKDQSSTFTVCDPWYSTSSILFFPKLLMACASFSWTDRTNSGN